MAVPVGAAVQDILAMRLVGVGVVGGNKRCFAAVCRFLTAGHRVHQGAGREQPEDQCEEHCHDRGGGAGPEHVGAIARPALHLKMLLCPPIVQIAEPGVLVRHARM